MTTAQNYAQRIIEEYKKHESARITQTIHAATALAGGALYKHEMSGNEYFYVLAILMSASAYGFWYMCEISHARTTLWMVQNGKTLEEAKARPSYAAGIFGQVATFFVILFSFTFSIAGLSFDFVLTESVYIEDRSVSFLIVAATALILLVMLISYFRRVMKLD